MTRHTGFLNHHEELRLDYLRKNIHYLNAREQRELDYLEAKAEGLVASPLPARSTRSRRRPTYEEEYAVADEWLDDEDDVPDYPVKPRKQRPTARPKAPKARVKPKKKRKKGAFKRFLRLVVLLLLLTIGGMVFMFFKGLNSTKTPAETKAARTEVFNGESAPDGVNILILGTDGRAGEGAEMTRTDSIMVLNINNKDKKVKLVSFMRDTLINIEGYDYKLNLAYTFGEQDNNKGAEAVRVALKENFDIKIKHYALIDFSTFATGVDTLFPNGVLIDARFSTVDGEQVSEVPVPDDLHAVDGVAPYQMITAGEQRMNGSTLLNYARYRGDDEGDYGRTQRQQQVMAAILSQVKDPTKLFTGSEALGKIFSLTSTSLPYSFILTNGLGAALDGSNGIEHITIPELGDWVDDYDLYGGLGLRIDFEKYKQRLAEIGLR